MARDDTRQVAAAERFIEQGAWVPLLAVPEAVWILETLYGLAATEIADAIEMLLDHESLVLQDHDVVAAAPMQFRARPSLAFSDCLILELARKAGHHPLGTFDRALGKLEGATLV